MKRDKTSRTVLSELLASLSVKTDWMILGFTNPYKFRNAMSGWVPQEEWDRMFEDRNKRQTLSRLRKKKWLAQEIKGGHVMYQLSDDALVAALKEQVVAIDKQHMDGYHSLVVFDFPEAAKKARTAFRTFLKQAGFKQKQLSVWISKKDVIKELRALIRLLNIEKWVEVYRAEN